MPIVALHGMASRAASWSAFAALASSHQREVVALELLGHGTRPRPGRYSGDLFRDDVVEQLRRFGSPVDLIGHSLGGYVATLVAQEHPGLVRRLVVEDVSPPPRDSTDPALPTRGERLTFALQSTLLLTRWRRFDLHMVRPVLDEIVLTANRTWWERLPRITVPCLLVRGQHGQMALDRAAAMASLLPDCSVVTIPNARHRVHSEQLHAFAAPVLEFLAGEP